MTNMKSKSSFAVLFSSVFAMLLTAGLPSAVAETAGAGWTAPAQSTTSSSGSTATGGSAAPKSAYIMPGSGGGSAAESGRSTQITQLATAAVNGYAASRYARICVRSKCRGCWACPLAVMAGSAAAQLARASGGSGVAGMAMSAYDPATGAGLQTDEYGNPTGGTMTGEANAEGRLPDGTTAQSVAQTVSRVRSELENSGVQLSPDGKTMTTPDGRKFDLTKGGDGSEKGLLDMGLLSDEASLAAATSKQIGAAAAAKYAGAAKMSADGSGGGGMGRGVASESDPSAGAWNSAFGRDPRLRPRVKPQVSGLTKKLGEDTIGVSGDDIFEMVTRRYKARDGNNQFLKD